MVLRHKTYAAAARRGLEPRQLLLLLFEREIERERESERERVTRQKIVFQEIGVLIDRIDH